MLLFNEIIKTVSIILHNCIIYYTINSIGNIKVIKISKNQRYYADYF